MEPSRLYGQFIRCEDRSAQLYLDVSVHFYDQVEISWFWIELAMEEKQHAGMLQYCKETGMFASNLPTTEQIQRLAAMFKTLHGLVVSPGFDLDQAFDVAITIESSEINEIYDNLTSNLSGPWYVIRKKIELSICNHFEKLRHAAERFSASEAVRTRLDQLRQAA